MTNQHIPHITIIGGGFSGTLLSLQLIQKSNIPLKISIIEKSSAYAKGVAYGTKNPKHLLNVPVEKMGALNDDPLHFYTWIKENPDRWRNLDLEFQHLEINIGDFVPRIIYGAYLTDLWHKILSEAKVKNCEIAVYQDEAVNVEVLGDKKFKIQTSSSISLISDYVVLATGVPGNKEFKIDVKSENYIHNIWSEKISEIKPNSTIALIGTGLTTIDAIINCKHAINPKFIAISKHGKWPQIHIKNLPSYPNFLDENLLPKKALDLFRIVRSEVKSAQKQGINWRSVLDSLRPITVAIWEILSLEEKKKLLKLISGFWNTHRHRRPEIDLREVENAELLAGSIVSIETNNPNGVKIKYQLRGQSSIKQVIVDYVINCAGPELNVLKNNSLLFKNLISNHLILSDPLHLGLQADIKGRVLGNGNGKIFAIGLLLTGCRFETVAVPELRNQCSVVADEILKINLQGLKLMSENTMQKLSNEKFAELKNSSYVIDTRQPEIFASCHVKDSINIPGGGSFCGWAGMIVPGDQPIILILENEDTLLETIEQLSLVGLTNISGFIVWDRNIHNQMDTLELLTPKDLKIANDVFIIDVRTPSEWNHGHISSAHHMELAKFKDLISQVPQNQKIATICGSGFRASIAASLLQKNGFDDVANVQGGMQAWRQANLPVIKGTL
jgi:uncharacterized NAD(P)/FAD-binding protein YdhS